jgi:catechol 2,3-dioxygenase-like lactoylglutathione lyase family enzyme
MNPEHISLVCLPVRDVERAKSFYTEVMGFKLGRDSRVGPKHSRWVELGPEGGQTSIALVDAHGRNNRFPVDGLVLKVKDLEQYRSRLKKHGVQPGDITAETWGSHLSLYDPDGNKWIIVDHEPNNP